MHATGRLALDGRAPMRPNTLFGIASLTKPFGSVLTLGLVDDGVLSLDDEVAPWG
ncbi:Beta-lactamase [Modestobacter sp. DSM 44400]|uniref:serine hydrolase n=1 Tax=Modestobacter sp. DSM 44400 TaxID=1550230 RepID=UPI0008974BFB|nr:serine hydrolase domain-containing protein [Modestobacter sp. DSM 44400]SDY30895.1 Beta-lactamase [Modestobacter sp. DSM 44400]